MGVFGSYGLVSPFASDAAYTAYGSSMERLGNVGSALTGGESASGAYRAGYTAFNAATLLLGGELGQAGRAGRFGEVGAAARLGESVAVSEGLAFGGSGFSLNPIEWYRNYQIMNRAREAGINVERTLSGQSADFLNGQVTINVSPIASSTVAMEEYLHARYLQIIGPDRSAQLLSDPVSVLNHEVRLKNLMIGAGRNGFLGSTPLPVDIDFLIDTRIGYSSRLGAEEARRPQ